jgi:hypothetical protein
VSVDRSELKQLVRDLRAEATAYNRQWHVWLSLASGGGAVAILSFAANLPDPDYALRALLPTLSAFAAGVFFSGLALFAAARRIAAAESHHAAAFTRDELGDAIPLIPMMISSPQKVAEEHNAPRDKLITQHDEQHQRAEAEWRTHTRWKFANRLFLGLAISAFMAGIILPLAHVSSGRGFAPTPHATSVH